MAVTIDNTSFSLPADEFTAQKVALYNSALNALQAAWTTWSPTWTNLTVGNGTVTCRYRQIGKLVICRVSVVFGSTTSISGAVSFTLPVTAITYGGSLGVTTWGLARCYDQSGALANEGPVLNLSTTTAAVQVYDASATYLKGAVLSSTVPFIWAVNDELSAQFAYEAA